MFKNSLLEVIIQYSSFIYRMHTGELWMCTFQISKNVFTKYFYNIFVILKKGVGGDFELCQIAGGS